MNDPGALHSWDADLTFAQHMGSALAIGPSNTPDGTTTLGIAWDVYLLYGRGDREIEKPGFWMHQLDVETAPRFDPRRRRAQEMLSWRPQNTPTVPPAVAHPGPSQ
jgi:hypothetical protein